MSFPKIPNYKALDRKANMLAFGMFPNNGFDLGWIDGTVSSGGGTEVADDLTAGCNGSNVLFTLSATPRSQDSILVDWNGLILRRNSDYTVSGTTLTLSTAPGASDWLVVKYWV